MWMFYKSDSVKQKKVGFFCVKQTEFFRRVDAIALIVVY